MEMFLALHDVHAHKSPFVWYVVLTVCVIEWGNWVCVEGMYVAKVVSVVIAL